MSAWASEGRPWVRRAGLTLALGAALLGLAGCGPEAQRVRGGGAGADIGNVGETVDIFEQDAYTRIYYQTPDDLPPVSGAASPAPPGTVAPLPTLTGPVVPPSVATATAGTPGAATPGATPVGEPGATPGATPAAS